MTFAENLARAAATATCSWFNTGGNAAVSTVLANGVITTGINPATVGAGLGLLALSYGCSYDPNNTGTPPGGAIWTGCKKSTGFVELGHNINGVLSNVFATSLREVTSVYAGPVDPGTGRGTVFWTGIDAAGGPQGPNNVLLRPGATGLMSAPMSGATCIEAVPGPAPNPVLPPVTHHDTVGGCDVKVEHLAWNLLPDGRIQPVLKMSPVAKTRTSGGVISGCNWDPVIWIGPPGGGGGGDTPVIPWLPPAGGDPNWWVPAVTAAIGGAVGAAIGAALANALPDLPAALYRLVSVCETDADGEPVSQSREVSIPAGKAIPALAERIDALVDIAQGLKDFKQPICRTRPQLTGEWVTVNFLSDENSPAGKEPLRKVFRYRDQTSASQNDHIAHWKGFSWQAGPVMVVHRGASWGTPKVWAQTPAEGKRVIRHAAAIAGVDTEAPGTSWIVSGASDPRYGQSGTMRVSHKHGVFHVSKRPTPDGLPQMAEVFLDS